MFAIRTLVVLGLSAAALAPAARAAGEVVEVTAGTLNVRAGVWGRILGSAGQGQRFVVREARAGWLGIDWSGQRAWISGNYARRVAGRSVVVTAGALNARPTPSTALTPLGQAHAGQAYARLDGQGAWVQIQFDRRPAWVHGDYVRPGADPAGAAPAASPSDLVPPAARGAIRSVPGASGTVRLNERTLAMLANARAWLRAHGGCDPARASAAFVTQGSYNRGGVAASAGTHDGGGVIDMRVIGLGAAERGALVRALRQAGFAAWVRQPPTFSWHIHAVAIGDPDLSRSARAQVAAYFRGRDGLARAGADPHGGPLVKAWMRPFMP
mgnify:CR=1 FL=1